MLIVVSRFRHLLSLSSNSLHARSLVRKSTRVTTVACAHQTPNRTRKTSAVHETAGFLLFACTHTNGMTTIASLLMVASPHTKFITFGPLILHQDPWSRP